MIESLKFSTFIDMSLYYKLKQTEEAIPATSSVHSTNNFNKETLQNSTKMTFDSNKNNSKIQVGSVENSEVELNRKRKLEDSTDEQTENNNETNGHSTNINSMQVRTLNHDKYNPRNMQQNVKLLMSKWGNVKPIAPHIFLQRLLQSRGYDHLFIAPFVRKSNRAPSAKQTGDYDNELVWAIRNSNLEQIKFLSSQGKSMSACNRFSESIVHMACRRAELDVVEFLLDNGGDLALVDDYGRTPLHDACWRAEPRFDIVTILMDRDLALVRQQDARGSIPLHYVREEHWGQWCAFLYHQREKYWAPLPKGGIDPHSCKNVMARENARLEVKASDSLHSSTSSSGYSSGSGPESKKVKLDPSLDSC